MSTVDEFHQEICELFSRYGSGHLTDNDIIHRGLEDILQRLVTQTNSHGLRWMALEEHAMWVSWMPKPKTSSSTGAGAGADTDPLCRQVSYDPRCPGHRESMRAQADRLRVERDER